MSPSARQAPSAPAFPSPGVPGPVVVPQRPPLQKRTYSAPSSHVLSQQQQQQHEHPPVPPPPPPLSLTPRKSDASILASYERRAAGGGSNGGTTAAAAVASSNAGNGVPLPRPLLHRRQPSSSTAAKSHNLAPSASASSIPSRNPDFDSDAMLQMNLVLVGAPNVGKSTFMQHTLDLPYLPSSFSATKKMSLDDTIYLVRLIELDVDDIAISANNDLIFPRALPDGRYLPDRIHGALAVFDSSDLTTLTKYPHLFRAFSTQSSLPSIVVASKCDCECLSSDEVFNQARQIMGATKVHQTAIDDKDSHKRCISTILNLIISCLAWRNLRRSELSHANDVHNQPHPSPSHQPSLAPNKNQPAGPSPKPSTSNASPASVADDLSKSLSLTPENRRANGAVAPSHSSRDAGHPKPHLTLDLDPERHKITSNLSQCATETETLFSDNDNFQYEPQDILASSARSTVLQSNPEEGLTFEELIARLVSHPTSKKDVNFTTIFLCLYRDFASPLQLLNALLGWYEEVDRNDELYLLTYASKLRLLNILSQWVSEHPGDFSAGTATRKNLYALISNIENDPVFAFSAKELTLSLDVVVEDCDAGAFRFGNEPDSPSSQEVQKQLMFTPTPTSTSPYDPALYSPSDTAAAAAASPIVLQTRSPRSSRNPVEDLLDAPSHNQDLRRGSADTLGNESWAHSSTTTNVPSDSIPSVTNLLATQQSEAPNHSTKSRVPVTKEATKIFFAVSDEEFANEITRMDWMMYSSMRLREMCRYVRTPLAKRSTDPNVQNVHRMVASFNHLAAFVVTMILSRDSPKARAKIMQRFIEIAYKLRIQNNYNSLGAIIAGLDQAPIFRLRQTHQLLDPRIVNKFKSLQILMGLRRSCYSYRLAWENSFSEKIVYLPLSLRDLNSAEVGNKTFLSGASTSSAEAKTEGGKADDSNKQQPPPPPPQAKKRINWRKFEIMGEGLMTVYYSQQTSHQEYPRSEVVHDLLFNYVVIDDEAEAINRSKLLEPAPNQGDGRMKRFYTFASRN